MASDNILDKLLSLTNGTLEKSHFDPLLSQPTATNIAKSLNKALSDTSDTNGYILKRIVRKTIVELIQQLCRRNLNTTYVYDYETKYDLLIKHVYYQNRNKAKRKYKYNRITSECHTFGSEIYNELSKSDIELGVALINLRTEECDAILSNIVENCLRSDREFDDATTEFLKTIWEYDTQLLSDDLHDKLCERLTFLLETKLLDLSSLLLEELSGSHSTESFVTNRINHVFDLHFPNFQLLIRRLSKSQNIFNIFFLILTDIFIKSNYDNVIQKVITHVIQEIRCRCTTDDLLNLYPYHLNNIVFYLETDPTTIIDVIQLYNYTINMIDNLFNTSKIDFVFLLSHYPFWLSHYMLRNE